MDENAEHRRYRRAVVSLSVKFSQGEASQTARALNLSATGMLIETKSPLPLSSRLKVAFEIPGTEDSVQSDGEVVWVNKYCANYPYGMAIKFLGLQEDATRAINKYVQKVLESPGISHKEDIIAIPD